MWRAQLSCRSNATDSQTLNSMIFIHHNMQVRAQTQLNNRVEGEHTPSLFQGGGAGRGGGKEYMLK